MARRKFYEEKVDHCKDPRSAWKYLNQSIGRRSKNTSIDKLVVEGHTISDPVMIANSFNDHFANATTRIVNEIPKTTKDFKDYLPEYSAENFKFKRLTYDGNCSPVVK